MLTVGGTTRMIKHISLLLGLALAGIGALGTAQAASAIDIGMPMALTGT